MPSPPRRLDGDGPYLCTRKHCGGVCDTVRAHVRRPVADPVAIERVRRETGNRDLYFETLRTVAVLHFRCRSCLAQYE